MPKFAHDEVVPYQNSHLEKKQQVAEMFNSIAFRYDFLNHFLSGGIDRYWRRKAILELKGLHPQYMLDVATGTGDFALMSYKLLKPVKITGIDIAEGMLEIGRKKIAKAQLDQSIELLPGDSETINFPDDTFEAITVAFGVRNFQNLDKGLGEMFRVLKPGGMLVVLEFSKPRQPLFKMLSNFYMNVITPSLGKLFAKNKDAYDYLNHSVQAFPERESFAEIMKQAGFKNTYFKTLSLGICSIYCGRK